MKTSITFLYLFLFSLLSSLWTLSEASDMASSLKLERTVKQHDENSNLFFELQGDPLTDTNSFITTWKISSSNDSIAFNVRKNYQYSYDVYWEKVGQPSVKGNSKGNKGAFYKTKLEAGEYKVAINGVFPYFNVCLDNKSRACENIIAINQWGTQKWKSMNSSFAGADNLELKATDTPYLTEVEDMSRMFQNATSFNGDLNSWDVSNVTNFSYMFSDATSFNGDLNNWDVSSGTNFSYMFDNATSFNQDISGWDVSSGTDFIGMFLGATSFNRDLNNWNVSKGTNFASMFSGATSFNQDISGWDVSSGTDFSYMFYNATSFNQDISGWDVSSGTDFSYMFYNATSFNRDLNNWNVSKGTNFSGMFVGATSFNQDISGWDVSSGTDFSFMFQNATSFNRDLNNWDVSKGTDFYLMFAAATSFNGDISSWNVSKGIGFYRMFKEARSFSSDLSGWDISQATNLNEMFNYSGMQLADYDKTLKGWASLATVPNNIEIGVEGLKYCLSKEYRDQLVSKGWKFIGDKYDCINSSNSFILEWDIDEQNTAITILTNPLYNYHYTVAYQKIDNPEINQISSDVTGNYISAVLPKGRYKVSIRGEFPHFRTKYPKQLRAITQWGTQQWKSMNLSFAGAKNLELKATDTPNLTEVEDMYGMFENATSFNGDVSSWDVSNVKNFRAMFYGATSFNGDLNNWDVSNVTNFSTMFSGATSFNGDLSNWDVSKGTDFYAMFNGATSFNQDLSGWDVSNVTNFSYMFFEATSFNQDLSGWDVSSGTQFSFMFSDAISFNQDISGWDVSSGTYFYAMLREARSFSQDLSKWDISQATNLNEMFNYSGMQLADYDKILKGWASLATVPNNIKIGVVGLKYCLSKEYRDQLEGKGWEFVGDEYDCINSSNNFILEWDIDEKNTTITILADPSYNYHYMVAYQKIDNPQINQISSDVTGNYISAVLPKGRYKVSIRGEFPHFRTKYPKQLRAITQWGTQQWKSMNSSFLEAVNLELKATDTPNLTEVEDMYGMFSGAKSFNGDLNNWDVSNVTNFSEMFSDAINFNGNLSNWDVSSGTDFYAMFYNAKSFNQDISGWDVSKGTDFNTMFSDAKSFNGDISHWDVSSGTDFYAMFSGATSFNQDISGWDVSKGTDFYAMFNGARSFSSDLSGWDISQAEDLDAMFSRSGMQLADYDKTLKGWASLATVPKGLMLGAEKVYYCSSEQEREMLIKKHNWKIYGDIKYGSDLVLKDKKVEYNGKEHTIEIKNLPSDPLQVEYIIYDEHKQEVKQAIDAGKYTVEAIIKGCSKEHRIKAFLTITKKPIRVTAVGAIKKYDGIAYKGGHGVFVEGVLEQDLLEDINNRVTYVGDSQGAVNIGTYVITPTELSLVNYQVTQYISGTLTIEKADLIGVELKDTVYQYDGELKSLAISGDIDIVTDVTYSNNSHSDAGEYKVEARVLAGDNYHPLSLEATLTIEKADLIGVELKDAVYQYDGELKSLAISGDIDIVTDVTYLNNSHSDAGEYKVEARVLAGDNYHPLSLEATLTIEKADLIGVELKDAVYRYDGELKSLAISGDIDVVKDVTYSNNSHSDAGEYKVEATVMAGDNYHPLSLEATLTIEKAELIGVELKDAVYRYDGELKSLAISGDIDIVTDVTYLNNSHSDAGEYKVEATVMAGDNYHPLSLEATLTIEKANQRIEFEQIPLIDLDKQQSVLLVSHSDAGLKVTYSVSNPDIATVDTKGLVQIKDVGQVEITANQQGNHNYLPAEAVSRTLVVTNSQADISELSINGRRYTNPESTIVYRMDCDDLSKEVQLSIAIPLGASASVSENFVIHTPKAGIYYQDITVESHNKQKIRKYKIVIEKPFAFKDIVIEKFGNTLLVNNNPSTNGGYKFITYQWFKNGRLIGTEQVYSAGNKIDDILDEHAEYTVVLTTDKNEQISSCIGEITYQHKNTVTLYPNPVSIGQEMNVVFDYPAQLINNVKVEVFSVSGALIYSTVLHQRDAVLSLPMHIQSGSYYLVMYIGDTKQVKTIIVKP